MKTKYPCQLNCFPLLSDMLNIDTTYWSLMTNLNFLSLFQQKQIFNGNYPTPYLYANPSMWSIYS